MDHNFCLWSSLSYRSHSSTDQRCECWPVPLRGFAFIDAARPVESTAIAALLVGLSPQHTVVDFVTDLHDRGRCALGGESHEGGKGVVINRMLKMRKRQLAPKRRLCLLLWIGPPIAVMEIQPQIQVCISQPPRQRQHRGQIRIRVVVSGPAMWCVCAGIHPKTQSNCIEPRLSEDLQGIFSRSGSLQTKRRAFPVAIKHGKIAHISSQEKFTSFVR